MLDAGVFLKAAMLSLFAIAVVRTAWMCDDAYITLRTVDNFVSGFGPRWNVAERVQTYTHPLWMFVLALPYYVTREAYFTPLVVSMLASLAAMWLLVTRIAVSSATAIIGASVLTFSRAFVEFSTSGLENPLTHLLLAIFFVLYWHPERAHRLTHLWIVVSLIMVNRLDAGLLVLPAMLVRTYQMGWRPGVKAVAIGVVPLVTWELFSIIYYGFPFPNTAYAKLSNGVPPGELASQGIAFLLNSAANDPLTLLAMGTFVSVALASYRARQLAPRAGSCAVCGLRGACRRRLHERPLSHCAAVLRRCAVCPLAGALDVVLHGSCHRGYFRPWRLCNSAAAACESGRAREPSARPAGIAGISDQRAFYYRYTGLLRWTREAPLPNYVWEEQGRKARLHPGVVEKGAVGMFGYFGGPGVHVVDFFALGDPLLARLPSRGRWRIGHYRRSVPRGYSATIQTGRNVIRDPDVAMKYEQLKIITQDPLWTRRRWEAIIAMNTGSQTP